MHGRSLRLAETLRDATAGLHREAERSGVIHDLLTRRADRAAFATLLRNLLPVYEALEAGLERHRETPLLGRLARPELYRSAALRADLAEFGGNPPVLGEGLAYAARVAEAASGDGAGLLAFAYVRYMGDLSGGQILNRLLSRTLGLSGLAFYTFPGIADPAEFASAYRDAIDQAGVLLGDTAPVVEMAQAAFRLDIDLSVAIGQ